MSTQRTLPTTDMLAHTPTTTSSAPLLDVPSLWTVLEHGMLMGLASMMHQSIQTRDAGCTSTPPVQPTMVMDVPTQTTLSHALPLAAPSLWTVLDLGVLTLLACMLVWDRPKIRKNQRCAARL